MSGYVLRLYVGFLEIKSKHYTRSYSIKIINKALKLYLGYLLYIRRIGYSNNRNSPYEIYKTKLVYGFFLNKRNTFY